MVVIFQWRISKTLQLVFPIKEEVSPGKMLEMHQIPLVLQMNPPHWIRNLLQVHWVYSLLKMMNLRKPLTYLRQVELPSLFCWSIKDLGMNSLNLHMYMSCFSFTPSCLNSINKMMLIWTTKNQGIRLCLLLPWFPPSHLGFIRQSQNSFGITESRCYSFGIT